MADPRVRVNCGCLVARARLCVARRRRPSLAPSITACDMVRATDSSLTLVWLILNYARVEAVGASIPVNDPPRVLSHSPISVITGPGIWVSNSGECFDGLYEKDERMKGVVKHSGL